nr:MAG TPA: interferon regulatory factor 2-binding protein [Caudoviricetes sp.]
MATAKEPATKITVAQARKKIETLEEKVKSLKDGAWCYLCDTHKSKDGFYMSTDPINKSGLTPICRECTRKIVFKVGKDGVEHEPDKESIRLALRYLNKPFLEKVWDSSIQETENLASGKVKSNVWNAYIRQISMGQYNTLTYADSDGFIKYKQDDINKKEEITEEKLIETHAGLDTYDSFLKNKEDVIRLLSYDPFEKEDISDQPFLYSQLLGLLDSSEDANEDMMRTSSAISIVRGFLQQSKIDDTVAKLMCDVSNIEKNSATIKSLQESKGKITSVITSLAQDSCISLKHNKNAKKGENTWTGKIKKIKSLNLRDAEVNGFDIDTCRGMQQVQEISDASIMKQLALDESEWSDMIAEMRVTNTSLRREKDAYQEINRILLRENLDLRDTLKEKDLLDENTLKDLRDLYSVFGDSEESSQEEDKDESK